MKTYFLGAIALSVCLGSAAQAIPRTINDCEKIEAADAYNQCLALFGPPAHKGMNAEDGVEGRSARQIEPPVGDQPQTSLETETPAKHEYRKSRHASRHYHHSSSGRHYAHHWRHRHVSSAFMTLSAA